MSHSYFQATSEHLTQTVLSTTVRVSSAAAHWTGTARLCPERGGCAEGDEATVSESRAPLCGWSRTARLGWDWHCTAQPPLESR